MDRSPDLILASILRLHIAGFAAGAAVPLAVFAQTDFIEALAEPAVFVAGAGVFGLIADAADKFLGHTVEISANGRGEQ